MLRIKLNRPLSVVCLMLLIATDFRTDLFIIKD